MKPFGATGILALPKWTQGVKSLYSSGKRRKKSVDHLVRSFNLVPFLINPMFNMSEILPYIFALASMIDGK